MLFDFNSRIEAKNIQLYAGWEKQSYTARVYLNSDKSTLLSESTVEFGSFISEPDYKKAQEGKEEYENLIFAGWYYQDGDEEKRFDFNTMAVKMDMDIYAKWTSKVPVPYKVRYVIEVDGEYVDIAEPTEGVSLAGISKSFTAKVGALLYDAYDTGYFPTQRSTSILMSNTEENEFSFIYSVPETVVYTVTHEFVSDDFTTILGTNRFTEVFEHTITGADIATAAASVVVSFREGITKSVVVHAAEDYTGKKLTTEQANALWTIITRMSPDYFEQNLVLISGDGNNNNATFGWEQHDSTAVYQVIYYVKTLGNEYIIDHTQEFVGNLSDGNEKVYATIDPSTIGRLGFVINTEKSVLTGEIVKLQLKEDGSFTGGLVLKVYYDREEYNYKVYHYLVGTTTPVPTVGGVPTTYTEKALFEQEISVSSLKLSSADTPGYYFFNSGDKAQIVSENQPVICYYQGLDVQYRYQIIGSNGASLDVYTDDTVVGQTPKQSTVTLLNDGFFFKGWYYSVGNGEVQPVPQEWVDGMTIVPPEAAAEFAGKTIYFYAEVLPLTRTFRVSDNVSSDQAFIFSLKGKSGTLTADVNVTFIIFGGEYVNVAMLPYGEYTLTVHEWAWRYSAPDLSFDGGSPGLSNNTFSVTLDTVGDVIINYSGTANDKWLTADASGNCSIS